MTVNLATAVLLMALCGLLGFYAGSHQKETQEWLEAKYQEWREPGCRADGGYVCVRLDGTEGGGSTMSQ